METGDKLPCATVIPCLTPSQKDSFPMAPYSLLIHKYSLPEAILMAGLSSSLLKFLSFFFIKL